MIKIGISFMSSKKYSVIDNYEEELSEDEDSISFGEDLEDVENIVNALIFEDELDNNPTYKKNTVEDKMTSPSCGFVDDYMEHGFDGVDGSRNRRNPYASMNKGSHKLRDKYGNEIHHKTLSELHNDFYRKNSFKKNNDFYDSLNEFNKLKVLLNRSLIEDYKEAKAFANKHKPFKMENLKSYYEKYDVLSKDLILFPSDENWSVEFLTKRILGQYEKVSKFMIGYLDFIPSKEVSGKDFRAVYRQEMLSNMVGLTYLIHAFKFNLKQGRQVSIAAPYFKDDLAIFNQEQNCLMLMNLLMDMVTNIEDFIEQCPSGKINIISRLQSIKHKYAPYFIFVLDYYLPLSQTNSDCDDLLVNNSKYFTFDTVKVLDEQERSMDKRKIAEQLRSLK